MANDGTFSGKPVIPEYVIDMGFRVDQGSDGPAGKGELPHLKQLADPLGGINKDGALACKHDSRITSTYFRFNINVFC